MNPTTVRSKALKPVLQVTPKPQLQVTLKKKPTLQVTPTSPPPPFNFYKTNLV